MEDCSAAAQAATPYPLGCFVGGPEYGPNVMNAFIALVGETPPVMNQFLDGTQPGLPNTGSNAYGAGTFATNAPWNTELSGKRAIIPLIGCPMGTTANSDAQNLAYLQGVAAGQFDSQLAGLVTTWAKLGFMTQYWRHGVEMNLTSTPGFDAYVNNPGAWIAAFQRIYTVQHAQAAALGVTLKILWNPGCCAGTPIGNATKTLYPGDAYCDIIAGDFYGDTQWTSGSLTQAELVASPTLLAQFYDNPAMGSPSAPTVDTTNGVCLSLASLAAFARARGKPFAVPECGAGGTPPHDNPVFWNWLRATLDAHVAAGGIVDHVSMWNSNDPEPYTFTGGQQPLACAAIKDNFGVGAPAPLAPQPTPAPAPAHAASPPNTQVNGTSGTIYDTAGNAWTISASQQIELNGTVVASSAGVVALFWTGRTLSQLNTAGAWWTQPLSGGPGTQLASAPAGYVAPTPAPSPAPAAHVTSPAGTQLPPPAVTAIYDTAGNTWTLPTVGGQIFLNGKPVASSADVVALYWDGRTLSQLNTAGAWWTQPLDGSAGTKLAAAPTGYHA